MSALTLALSKGRIFEETLPLLRAAGVEVLEDPETSRKLILPTNQIETGAVAHVIEAPRFAGCLLVTPDGENDDIGLFRNFYGLFDKSTVIGGV